jgi:hypothetical protein
MEDGMMRRITGFVSCVGGIAVLALVLLSPRPATSATRNVAGAGCPQLFIGVNGYFSCPVTTEGTTYTMSGFSGAWFDFVCPALGTHVAYSLYKDSYTGTFYADNATFTCTAGGASEDFWLPASNVLTNASTHDYLWANIGKASFVYGVEAEFQ